jgi:hypothetical protein
VRRVLGGWDDGDNVTNVQCKFNWNCHYEFPPVKWIHPNKERNEIEKEEIKLYL